MPAVAIPLAGLTVIATLLGGHIALRLHHSLPTVIALTGGIVVAVALFDVLPEGIENVGDTSRATALVAVGFLLFFFAERALVLHHRDDPDEARAHERVGVLGALGLSVHSFIDGLGIGLAFGLDATTGFLVFIAVVSHDFADGLNTVSFILSQSGDRKQATRWLMDRCDRAPAGGDRRLAADGLRRRRSATCSASTAASSSTWARPTCSPRPMPTPPGRKSG